MIRVIVAGTNGRMSNRIAALVEQASDLTLAARIARTDSLSQRIDEGEVIIDFTSPETSVQLATAAVQKRRPLVIGTTGLTADHMHTIRRAASDIPIVFSPNMSLGVNVLFALVNLATRTLGKEFAVEITEVHHVHKKDKPSGTAKRLLDVILKHRGKNAEKQIPVHSLRQGEVIGDHTVTFTSANEKITLAHHAGTRDIFAEGAIVAARWVIGKPPGFYDMSDVLGLK
ncbi:MAG: 4-hydroxy-tetrahydrodipicolinate reductase [Deltaproteobacteria bacterium]|nr:4-hydroxy-tetrahydrodipicolinate reductase [Deltaproteobacteria bacterium]